MLGTRDIIWFRSSLVLCVGYKGSWSVLPDGAPHQVQLFVLAQGLFLIFQSQKSFVKLVEECTC